MKSKVLILVLVVFFSLSKIEGNISLNKDILDSSNTSNGEIAIDKGSGSLGSNSIGETTIKTPTGTSSSQSGTTAGINVTGSGNGNISSTNNNGINSTNDLTDSKSNSLSTGTINTPGSTSNSSSATSSNILLPSNTPYNINNGNINANISPIINTGSTSATNFNTPSNINSYNTINTNINYNTNSNTNLNNNINTNSNSNQNNSDNTLSNIKPIPNIYYVEKDGRPGKSFVAFKFSNSYFISCSCDGVITAKPQNKFENSFLFIPKLIGNKYSFRSYYGGYITFKNDGSVDCFSRIRLEESVFDIDQIQSNKILIKNNEMCLTQNKNKISMTKFNTNSSQFLLPSI